MGALRRELTFWDLTAVTVGSVVGIGIFVVPSIVAAEFPSGPVILVLWAFGGLITLAGALALAELAAMFPRAGGPFDFIREAWGDRAGFVAAWGFIFTNTNVVGAYAFAFYVSQLFPLTERGVLLLATWSVACVSFINWMGVKMGGRTTAFFTLLKAASLASLVFFAFVWSGGASAPADAPAIVGGGNLAVALLAILYAYASWLNAAYLGEEAKNPERTLPRALAVGVLIVMTLYLGANAAYLKLLGPFGMAASDAVAADALSRVATWGAVFMTGAIVTSTFGSGLSLGLASPRLTFALARDGLLPRALARTNFRDAPGNAIIFRAMLAVGILWSGSFVQFLAWSTFLNWGVLGLSTIALFHLRRKRPDAPRPYRVVGYPFTPVVFVAGVLFVLVMALRQAPREAAIALGVVLTGLPLYEVMARVRRRAQAAVAADADAEAITASQNR